MTLTHIETTFTTILTVAVGAGVVYGVVEFANFLGALASL